MTKSKEKRPEDSGAELTGAEWAIIRTIWKLEPCTAPDVTESLAADRKWSYSTVKTMMDRMVDKGLLTTEKLRNLILYRSAITVNEAQKGEVLRTLKRAFDGALTPMMQFLIRNESLSKEDIREIEALLKEKKK